MTTVETPLTRRHVHEPVLIDPPHDARLQRIELIASLMDEAFVIPGTNRRVGWDALIGLIPGLGDVATSLVAAWIVYEARQLGLPRWKLARMLGNIGIDTLVGTVPLLGDLFDVAFKANRKNAEIVRRHFGRRAAGVL